MTADQDEIAIGSEEFEIMANRELGKQCINGSYLNSFLPACCLYGRGFDMVGEIGNDQGEEGETFDKVFALFWSAESLQ